MKRINNNDSVTNSKSVKMIFYCKSIKYKQTKFFKVCDFFLRVLSLDLKTKILFNIACVGITI